MDERDGERHGSRSNSSMEQIRDSTVPNWTPQLGMKFQSVDEAWKFWEAYGSCIGFEVRKRYTNKRKSDGKARSCRYVCAKEGHRTEDKRDHLTKCPRAETRCDCGVRMGLVLEEEVYKVTKLFLEHNHILHTPETFHLMVSQRKISEIQAFEIEAADDSGIRPKDAHELASRQVDGSFNLSYTCRDHRNYLRSKRQREMAYGEAGSMLRYFEDKTAENPSFQHALQKDCDGQIANIFWADAKMLIDYAHFGDVITFDTTFGTNKESRPFGIFVGFNHFRETVIFGAALMYDETFESFQWLFDTFLKAHNGKQPKTIFTDQDSAMGKAVGEVFIEAWHGLCTFHIMQNALKHLHQNEILRDFSACMFEYVDKPAFEEAFDTMRSKVDKQSWLDSIYKLKEKWAACYMKDVFTLGMRSTQLSESLNSDLKDHFKSNLDIIRLLKQFERVVQGKRNKEMESTFDSRKKIPRIKMRTPMLLEASKLYTPIIFEAFQDEYERSMRACTKALDGTNEYLVTIESLDKKLNIEECEVIGNRLEQSVICTCGQFNRVGILCGHALKVLDLMNIKTLPTQYILKRWTREARYGTIQDNQGRNIIENPMLDAMLRSKLLSHKFHSLTDQVASSLEICLLIDSTLDMLIKQVEEKMHACRITSGEPYAESTTHPNVEASNDLLGMRLKKKKVRISTSRRTRTWLDKKRMPTKKAQSKTTRQGKKTTQEEPRNDGLEAQIAQDNCSRDNITNGEEYGAINTFTELLTGSMTSELCTEELF